MLAHGPRQAHVWLIFDVRQKSMPSHQAGKLLAVLMLAPLVAWLSSTKRGTRILMWFVVVWLGLIGVGSITSERFVGRHRVGLMTGRPAVVVGSVFLGAALYVAFALVSTRNTSARRDE